MNTFGRIYRVTIYGESHGPGVGVIIDGCPPGIKIDKKEFKLELKRRHSGIRGTTKRKETDSFEILSGVFEGHTTGFPINIFLPNVDVISDDYEKFRFVPRPGHADYTAYKKYKGFNDFRGGGMFSGRLTAPLVAAGFIAKKIVSFMKFNSNVIEVGGKKDFEKAIKEAIKNNDTIGGVVECVVSGIPVGLGEPFFDGIESTISHLVFSIPGIKAIEFGNGINLAKMKGSEVNDILLPDGTFKTNNLGGIIGGISNGNDIVFRVFVRPPSSISKEQESFDLITGEKKTIVISGRHDVCIALRLPVVIEAAAAIALADAYLAFLQWKEIKQKYT